MVDLELLLREHGREVDAEWVPVSTTEVYGRLESMLPQPRRGAISSPVRIMVLAGLGVVLLFVPIWLLMSNVEPEEDPLTPPITEVPSGDPLVLYTNEEDGYQLLLPGSWVAGATGPDGSYTEPRLRMSVASYPGVRRFGTSVKSEFRPALTISFGELDGSVHSCLGLRIKTCREVSLADIEEMREFLANEEKAICSGSGTPGGSLIESESALGGNAAGVMRLDSIDGRCRVRRGSGVSVYGSIQGSHHIVYTIHDGRPVILSFDRLTAGTFTGVRRELPTILESFEFID